MDTELAKKHFKTPAEYKRFKKLVNETKIYDEPASLNGQLRPYQKIGYSWLVQNIKNGFGSILADDMGLGKTIQILSAILYYKENNLRMQLKHPKGPLHTSPFVK